MSLDEYIEQAKRELDEFRAFYLSSRELCNPDRAENHWPLDLSEGEWGEQELAHRFP